MQEQIINQAIQTYCEELGITQADLDDSDYMRIASSIFTDIAQEIATQMSDPRAKNYLVNHAEIEV